MKYKVGIPRALFFYDFFELFNTFFEELGVEVILSSKTNKKILDNGVLNSVDDACLPVKVLHGHIIDLIGKVDFIFLPRIKSTFKHEYECPKIIGTPEMIKNSVSNLPFIIQPTIDLSKSMISILNAIFTTSKYFTTDIIKVIKAYQKAIYTHYKRIEKIKTNCITLDLVKQINLNINNGIKVLLLGHSYNIFDSFISMNIIEKLTNDVNVLLSDMYDEFKINKINNNQDKQIFWSFGKKTIGSAYIAIKEKQIDGIVYVSSFGCGIDSVITDLIQREAIKNNIPFTLFTLDEHTGEAGINTRLEAFLDMIKWRKENENNISTHG